MASAKNFLTLCASALALTLACVRAENTHTATAAPDAAGPDAGNVAASELLDPEAQGDDTLAAAREADRASRAPGGTLPQLSPTEHMRRAGVYHANRAFAEARAHWQTLIARYPDDANVPAAMFGIGRSLFQERRHAEALPVFEKLGNTYQQTEPGRDGFYYVAATLLRLERASEAAARYVEYVTRFPDGERIENAYLNIIDTWREAGRPEDALPWVARTRERFAGKPAATNALFARLRLEVGQGRWQEAVQTSDELLRGPFGRGVQTSAAEVNYLKAYSLERAGRKEQAAQIYQTIADGVNSYYGWRATERLLEMSGAAKAAGKSRNERVRAATLAARGNYPTPFREIILRATEKKDRVDPRLVLAIMRQESGFNPRVKSRAAARGLMQLTVDTAAKYAERVGLARLRDDDFYRPEVSIPVAVEYLVELTEMFPKLPEAVAASYNGGEDNAARWVKRATHDDPGVFASEVGFTETKDYVNKVMANYRAYRHLYNDDLRPRD